MDKIKDALARLPTLNETINQYGLGANKKLGQHFLLDTNITDKITRLAMPLKGFWVAEIGPGPGGLTRSLLKSGADHIAAVEMDSRFINPLKDIQAIAKTRVEIINADALTYNIGKQAGAQNLPVKIIANLPYNVGTKLLTNWLTAKPLFWQQAVLMFQKEVAQRITAKPSDKAYGRLAVLAQSVCHCHYAFEVPARAFTPAPKVDSAVIVLDPLSPADRFTNLTALSQITQAAFGQRRKMLRKSLKSIAAKHNLELDIWLKTAGADPEQRPETLPISAFQKLAEAIS